MAQSAQQSGLKISRSLRAVSFPRCSGLSIFTATSLPSNVAEKTLQNAPHLGGTWWARRFAGGDT